VPENLIIGWYSLYATTIQELTRLSLVVGGVLSPILFCVYLDFCCWLCGTLAGARCFIGQWFVGALAYTDDIVLLVPVTARTMLKLLICDELLMKINANKSARMKFFQVDIGQ
jgi:hypothetical protein